MGCSSRMWSPSTRTGRRRIDTGHGYPLARVRSMDDPPAADDTAPAEEPGADDAAADDAAADADAGVEPEGADEPVRPPLEQRAATLLVRLAAVGLVIVVVTGIPLIWRYHPGDIVGLRAIHVLGSTLL